MKKIILLVISLVLGISITSQAAVYLNENWDTGTPPANWPNSCSNTTFHGWQTRGWDCGTGGNGAGLSSTIYHTPPYSYHNLRRAGEYFDAGTIIWNFPTPYPRKIHLRFYLYLPSSGWSNFDPTPGTAGEEMTHFLFTNSAASGTGFRINLLDNSGYNSWPPSCVGGMYFGCEIGDRGGPNNTASPDCWNMKNHLGEWHAYEWMWDIPNGLWSHWIDGVQKTNNVPINIAQEQSDFRSLILSGFSSYLRNWQGDFYIDDIVVSDTYIGLIGTSSYTVGGSVSGLTGTVVLQNNGGDNLSRSANGTFTFATPIVDGGAYSVTVLTQPSGQTCSVSNGSGTVAGGNITNVSVSCVNNSSTYTVGGSITGLNGTVVLQNNGGDNLSRSSNGAFTFTNPLSNGAAYSVEVLTHPAGQTCVVANGSGTINSANVTNVSVSCTSTYTVGGSLSGFSGNGSVTIQNNGGDDLHLAGNGAFVFSTALVNGSAYLVSVSGQPSGQTCTVSNGAGTISGSNITGVAISCVNTGPPARVPSTVTGVSVR